MQVNSNKNPKLSKFISFLLLIDLIILSNFITIIEIRKMLLLIEKMKNCKI